MKMQYKIRKKEQRNKSRILGCKLHSFDCFEAIQREKARQEKYGVRLPLPPIAVRCRCKNCGGTMSLMYAAAYMEAVKHMSKQEATK